MKMPAAWSGAAFGVPVAFRMSTNSVPSLVRVLCAVIENETGYRRLSRFPAQSPALQRLAKKNGTWDLAQTRSDDGAEPGGQVGRGSIPGPSPVLPNYSRQEPKPPQKRARLRSTRVDLFLFFFLKYFTRSILSNMISIPTNFQFPVSLLLFQ